MSKFLDEIGLGHLIEKIKQTFIRWEDTSAATTIDIDTTPTANSDNLVTSGGVKNALDALHYAGSPTTGGTANKTASIPFGVVDSTSTSTAYTATVDGITELRDGICVLLQNSVVTSASGFTININGLGAKPIYNNLATGNPTTPTAPTRDTTIFNINYTMLFIYHSTLVDGGAWICYRGYDANTNTIGYQLRANSYSKAMTDITYRYRILFSSADDKKWVPSTTSTSTNATSSRAVCQTPINPFGEIVYYGTTASVAAGSRPAATSLWQQYTLTFGYAFNRTGAALTLTSWTPIYIKCAPQANGSAIIDADTPYVQSLPTTEDGKIYIFLGVAYSATAVELLATHPIYYYKDGAIRQWTNAPTVTVPIQSISVNGTPQAPVNGNVDLTISGGSLPNDYAPATGSNEDLALEGGDTYDEAFAKLDKTIQDDSYVISTALNDLNLRVNTNAQQILTKQDELVSGVNIKTINNESILGSGNITITAGAGEDNVQSDWNESDSTDDAFIKNKPAIPAAVTESTVSGWGFTKNAGTITGITMNGTSKGTSGVIDLGTVLTSHQDISGKADKSAAIGSLSLAMNSTNYQITLSGTKVDGTTFTVSDVIDLPLESVVVSGSYDSNTKKVILTLKNGSTIDFSVADLISGLQSEITSSNKLSADLVQDGTTNKVYTATEKTKLAGIATGAEVNVQSDWDESDSTNDAYIKNKPVINTITINSSTLDNYKYVTLIPNGDTSAGVPVLVSGAIYQNNPGNELAPYTVPSWMAMSSAFAQINDMSGTIASVSSAIANMSTSGGITSISAGRIGGNGFVISGSTVGMYGSGVINIAMVRNDILEISLDSIQTILGSDDIIIDSGGVLVDDETLLTAAATNALYHNVQADWDESDESDDAFIKNKPTIPENVLSSNYAPSTLTNDDLALESGDDYEEAFGKLEKAIVDNELVTASALNDLNNRLVLTPENVGALPDYERQYLTFEAIQDSTFSFTLNELFYSLDDGETWICLAPGDSTPTVTAGNKIMWANEGLSPDSSNGIGTFSATGEFIIYGNIMSLYYKDNFYGQKDLTGKPSAFRRLFQHCYNAIDASNLILPATTLSDSCYRNMFNHNGASQTSKLRYAPKLLPATNLVSYCYQTMFQSCGNLLTTPEFRAETVGDYCCQNMFYVCSSLKSSDKITLAATTLAQYCYYNLFGHCTNLTTVVELPATTLANGCYYAMYYNCPKLTKAPELPATTMFSACYRDMFYTCTGLTTLPALPATTLAENCYNNMFYGCTGVTVAPDLPATTLATNCYYEMFQACSNLSYVKCLATNISATNCTLRWLDAVASNGIFVKNDSMSSWTTGVSGIPTTWTTYNNSEYEVVRHYELSSISGGDTNVIETIKVNGTALTPDANKAVDISVPTISVTQTPGTGSDITLNGSVKHIVSYSQPSSSNEAAMIAPTWANISNMPAYGITSNNISSWNNKQDPLNFYVEESNTGGYIRYSQLSPYMVAQTYATIDGCGLFTTTDDANTYIDCYPSEITIGYNSPQNSKTVKLNSTGFLYNNVQIATLNDIPSAITESTVSGWGFTKNAGTITGINMNGVSKGTSGVVDLGTVITSETALSKGTTSGSGNAVTDISVNGHQITLTKGSTFLTSHQSIKTINNTTLTGTGNVTINELPSVTSSDNGKILMVVNGAWSLVSPTAIYSGTATPSDSSGSNGDLYLQTS